MMERPWSRSSDRLRLDHVVCSNNKRLRTHGNGLLAHVTEGAQIVFAKDHLWVPGAPSSAAGSPREELESMQIQAINTPKITTTDRNVCAILESYLAGLDEGSIVAICQGRVVAMGTVEKHTLIEREADSFLPPDHSTYQMTLTITQGLLGPTAGIDASNGNGDYVLWPHALQDTAKAVWA
jgi:hypothetical protein